MSAAIRVLLVDDHETVREGLKAILKAEPDIDVIGEAADGDAGVAGAKAHDPDVVVMDVSMPGLSGLKATEAIARACPRVKVLVLSRHSDAGHLQQLLRAGAAGYVLKQSRATELLNAIRALARGGKYLDPTVTGIVIGGFRRGAPAQAPEVHAAVSPREEEILRLVAWGYSNKEIAAQLALSVKTVETHKANATQKLGLRSRIDVVRYAVLHGWLQDA